MNTVHHDGSDLFVSNPAPELGDTVRLRLWTAEHHQPAAVVLRTVIDGEPFNVDASVVAREPGVYWWEAELPMSNPVMHYRWLLVGGAFEYTWLNAGGTLDYDVPDANDFVITTHGRAPDWAIAGTVYQIYPDRFARAHHRDQLGVAVPPEGVELPEWATPRAWDLRPEGRSANTPYEYFGGDLIGLCERLAYIADLGATTVYLTPVFPARSTHRYDASAFDRIDPLLGGDQALIDLAAACHAAGLRIVGDITLNHCGAEHPWFIGSDEEPYRSYFRFGDEFKHGYASWWDVPSLPKFNYESAELREALITGERSPIRQWLGAPYDLDGWRVDVANMAGRLGSVDLTHEVAREVRRTMDAVRGDHLLVAEHGHDASADLDGDGWHGTMNYAGFTRQVWCWLRSAQFQEGFLGLPIEVPQLTGPQVVASWRAFHSRIPWQQLLGSWNILSSHDTARIRTVVGSAERQIAALALAIGLPGVPMVYAGDEIGLTGWWGEDGRVTFPWHDESTWDLMVLDAYRRLLHLRTSSPALQAGGLRWLDVSDDVIAFARQSRDQHLVVAVSRSSASPLRIPLPAGVGVQHRFGFPGEVQAEHLVLSIPHAGASVWELM